MHYLLNNAADLMDSGDDLTVIRDSDDGTVLDVRWHHTDQPVEYLRGMVELITESFGMSMDNKHVIYDEILRRLTNTRVVDL